MIPTAKKTKQKFYNKYVYKVSFIFPGSGALRYYDFDKLIDLCSVPPANQGPSYSSYVDQVKSIVWKNKNDWLKMVGILTRYDKKEFQKRLESDILDFYTNNDELYNDLCNTFPDRIRIRFQPPEGKKQEILDHEKQILVKTYPHNGKYKYKTFLQPHRIPSSDRSSLDNWLKKQGEKITYSDSISRWLLGSNHNWDRRYILVDEESTLLMIKMRSPMLIGSTLKYVISDK